MSQLGVAKRAIVKANPKRKIAFARAIETLAKGDAPEAARLWRAGWNKTDKGDLNFTPNSLIYCLEDQENRGNPIVWYYNHEDEIPLKERGGAPMKGIPSASGSILEGRGPDTAPELWANHIDWTDTARGIIQRKEMIQLSPIAAFDKETREIVAVINVSLCAEGATHYGTLLASREGRQGSVDDLYEKLMQAIDSEDWETAESLIQEMEASDGGDAMARMTKLARAAMKAGKMAKPPAAAVEPEPVATKRLAAARATGIDAGYVETFDRAIARMDAATNRANAAANRSDRQTVVAALSRAREEGIAIDGIDEREHIAGASPEATERFLASLRRMAKRGVLVASKDAPISPNPAKPVIEAPGKRTLTPGERTLYESFNRGKDPKFHITEEEYLANSARHGFEKPAKVGVA